VGGVRNYLKSCYNNLLIPFSATLAVASLFSYALLSEIGGFEMRKNTLSLFAAVLVLVIASIACGSTSAGGTVVSTAAANQPTLTPVQMQTNNIGDVVQSDTQYITLNSAQITGSSLQANFTVENKGSDSLTISSLMSFEAKGSDGTKLSIDIMDCPSGSLDGTILAGDKLKGNICWSGVTTDSVKIYYTPNFLGDTVIVWEVKK
jgi:hypothetical protein